MDQTQRHTLVLAKKHLELTQTGLSREKALRKMMEDGDLSGELNESAQKEMLGTFVRVLERSLEGQFQKSRR